MKPEGDAPVYVISVSAKLTGLPAWMLRLLDQEGIVVPRRTEKNRRLYSDNDITRLERIRYLTEERGVNMAGVRVLLEIEERVFKCSGVQVFDDNPDYMNARTPEYPAKETVDDLSRR